jgi:hypothetical protein
MKCVRCGKPVFKPRAMVTLSDGKTACWGPKCAVIAGLAQRPRRRPTRPGSPALAGPHQLDWVDALCRP